MLNCTKCEKEIEQKQPALPYLPPIIPESNCMIFSGKPYHTHCLVESIPDTVPCMDKVNVSFDITIFDMVRLVTLLHSSDVTSIRKLIQKLSATICEYDSQYILCANCGKLKLRRDCIIGAKTKAYQSILIKQLSEDVTPENKEYDKNGKAHRVLMFCSIFCDGNYSSKLHLNLQNRTKLSDLKIKEYEDKRTRNLHSLSFGKTEKEIADITKILDQQLSARKKLEWASWHRDIRNIVKKYVG